MRVLVATSNRSIVGGAETYVRAVLRALGSRGHQVAVIYEVPAAPGVPTVDDNVPGVPVWSPSAADRGSALKTIGAWKPQVVYSHGLADADLENVITRVYPTILFAHNYYGTCAT